MIAGTLALCWSATLCGLGPVDRSIERVDLPRGHYWLARPARMDPDTRYPLIVCLHGTETRASDILSFWLSLDAELPFIFVAPQGVAEGWRDNDLAFLEELRSHVEQTVSYDPQRLLLTGHSAGGAMAFHLLYAEDFPASAVAVTANYVPPTVTAEMAAKRQDVPLFYAVGEADLNRPRMRDGLYLLRGAGARVTVERPPIGHVLSRQIGQSALAWFESACRKQTREVLNRARRMCDGASASPGPAAFLLEGIVRHRRSHFADQAAEAVDLLQGLQAAGQEALRQAERLIEREELVAARQELLIIERAFYPSSLSVAAKKRRQAVDSTPAVAAQLASQDQRATRQAAETLWQAAVEALQNGDIKTARRRCQNLLSVCPQSRFAANARQVLDETQNIADTR